MSRIIAALVLWFVLFTGLGGCGRDKNFEADKGDYIARVHFIDVGQGDCAYIVFPDGKDMLIDCGFESQDNFDKIARVMGESGKDGLDYLLLTHPEQDHLGGAARIISELGADKIFMPFVTQEDYFPSYAKAKSAAEQTGAEIVVSTMFLCVKGQDYRFEFLWPIEHGNPNSPYGALNGAVMPSADQINAVSAVVYIECAGVRFVFSGDAGAWVEREIVKNLQVGLYGRNAGGLSLENVDFYKVAHHGSNDASGQEFLNVLRPKNAVISCGGANVFGHPSTSVLERLLLANSEHRLWRTDTNGTVSVYIDKNGQYYTDSEA